MAVLISVLLEGMVLPQTSADAPVDWTTYKIGDHKLSINFPKLPIRYDQQNSCEEKRIEHFVAYAEQAVYRLSVAKKPRSISRFGCPSVAEFGVNMLNARRAELEKNSDKISTTVATELWSCRPGGTKSERVWLVDDLKNGRWIELAVTGRGDLRRAEEFVASLLYSAKTGVDIEGGSAITLGDRGVDTTVRAPSLTAKSDAASMAEHEGLVIVSKVRARYTDAARSNGERGTVTLRVNFLANGGIGDIEVINSLKYGLTEQAIAAARRMVFLPQRFKGVPVRTSRPVSFAFNIY
ncbi:MAG: TonB family protein [Pyrinomonadaceae bacterium]